MKHVISIFAVLTLISLSACMTPAEEMAFDREVCRFDGETFVDLEPGDGAFEYCLELQESGIGPDDDPDARGLVGFQFFDD
jgi:hypothetical protein